MSDELRVIVSGGGTGGHIFPAVSIANAIKELRPEAKILFVGALGRMEMQRVPAAGYEIKGLPIQGFDRKNLLKNVKVLFKIWKSQRMAKKIIKERGLEAVVNDSTYECASKSIKPGQVIPGGQQPTPGYQVKKGRKVYLTYLAYTKQPATMPNINGESVETAKSLILGAGLIPGKITERENPHKGLVLEAHFNGAKVSAGKQLYKGDIIDLIIGKGEEDDDSKAPYSDDDSDTDIFNQTEDEL